MPTVYNQQTPTFQQPPVYQQVPPFYTPQMFRQLIRLQRIYNF
jgi:hypothetical protein